jgi:hypothetical protein
MVGTFRGMTSVTAALVLLVSIIGCGQSEQTETIAQDTSATQPERTADGSIQLTGGEVPAGHVTPAGYTEEPADPFRTSIRALRPLHGLIGSWRGMTVRAIGGAKAIENPEWNWDFLTDPQQPALVLKSKSSPYLKQARLTYRADRRLYQLFVTSANGSERILEGSFTQKPQSTGGSAHEPHTYQLRLVQVTPDANAEALVFTQKDGEHYRVEVHRMNGDALALYDAVEATRERSNATLAAGPAAGQRCVVSGGFGTIPLLFDGKPYHVCCEGCKAAFMADPRRWITESTPSE